MVTQVNSSTFLTDVVSLIRDKLDDNITDPISSSRGSGERFVMTSYPRRAVKYPIITVVDNNPSQIQRMGMQSEESLLLLGLEIRIWARNVKERDTLFQQIYTWLRTNQYGGVDSLVDANLHDYNFASVVNVDEMDVKSKVMEINFLFVTE
jgi:hypothetical protein